MTGQGMRKMIAAAALALACGLAGCASAAAVREAPADADDADAPAAAREDQARRSGWMAAVEQWSFVGRAAVRRGDRGGSGRIEWTQRDREHYEVALSAPVTRQSWRLIGDLHSEAGRIEGLEGGPREGEDAEALLADVTGWQVPVQQFGSWVRGAPASAWPVDGLMFDAEGRPTELRQAGWTVRYLAWRPGLPGQPDLPAKIEAESGEARVRLMIDDWTFATP